MSLHIHELVWYLFIALAVVVRSSTQLSVKCDDCDDNHKRNEDEDAHGQLICAHVVRINKAKFSRFWDVLVGWWLRQLACILSVVGLSSWQSKYNDPIWKWSIQERSILARRLWTTYKCKWTNWFCQIVNTETPFHSIVIEWQVQSAYFGSVFSSTISNIAWQLLFTRQRLHSK